jgi:hypothetical protein
MTFKQFEKHILRLKELTEEREKIENVMKKSKLSDSFNDGLFGTAWYEILIVDILKDAFNDESDWIGYWIYELEFGKTYKQGCVKDRNNKPIPLKTINDLYNLLTEK